MINNSTNNNITFFAETNFRNRKVKFGIKTDDRRRHMYLIGKTGTGKSVTMENMIISDINKGNGVAVVDPHGETVEKVVRCIPSFRINDVIYFNPADTDYPLAFNILENINPQYKNLIAQGLVGVFKKIWADTWGPRLEYILMNTILALLEYPGSTLLGVTRMLVDKNYRKKVVAKITDPIVKAFWIDEYANYNERFRTEAISPIQNKVGQFLSSSIIRNIVGQPKSTIDMRKIMDEKKILLLNLSKGRIGEENSALLGAMMITKIQLAAMSRVDVPEDKRNDFYLYVDEFQNFSTESFANILSEARKYRLNLIMAHQYIEQLDDSVRASIFGNVGTIICFRVGAEDAEFLEKEFLPYFEQNDLVNLPNFNVYLKLMINGLSSDPFSATTFPPLGQETDNFDKIVRISREHFATPIKTVEEKILKWSGVAEIYRATAEEDNIVQKNEDDEIMTEKRLNQKEKKRNQYSNEERQPQSHKSVVRIVENLNSQNIISEQKQSAITLREAMDIEPISFGKHLPQKKPDNVIRQPKIDANKKFFESKKSSNSYSQKAEKKHTLKPGQIVRILK